LLTAIIYHPDGRIKLRFPPPIDDKRRTVLNVRRLQATASGGGAVTVAVVTDSIACIPPALVTRYGIHVVPLRIIFGMSVYRDGIDLTADESPAVALGLLVLLGIVLVRRLTAQGVREAVAAAPNRRRAIFWARKV
jgi:hypothetical protein